MDYFILLPNKTSEVCVKGFDRNLCMITGFFCPRDRIKRGSIKVTEREETTVDEVDQEIKKDGVYRWWS